MAGTFSDPSVEFINAQVISPEITNAEAMGKTYQAVSQSMSLTVQDATDNLRNFSTVNLAALSYAQEKLVQSPPNMEEESKWALIISNLQKSLTSQIGSFKSISEGAAGVLQAFVTPESSPPSSTPPPPESVKEPAPLQADFVKPSEGFFNKLFKRENTTRNKDGIN